ncbi:MAG: hypothetical protein HOV76_32425 [Hamadaea sp.]|nr:hypothetical protein [Hamadaea sp.]
MPNSDVYTQAIRSGLAIWYTVDASLNGTPVAGATGLRPSGGSITDTTKPGVRRTLNLELPPTPGLFDALSPIGTTLTVTAHVRLTNYQVIDIPMGVFDVDVEKIREGGGGISLTAPDWWAKIQRYRFLSPVPSGTSMTVVDQIKDLVLGAIDWAGDFNILTSSTAMTPALVWEKDRAQAIIDLATSIGCWVYFDRNGIPTIADIPTSGGSADWLVDASASGVLTELDRERSRTNTYNVVVVSSSATDGERFPPQYVFDNDPASPTYAGTDPIFAPGSAGPFGIVSYFYDTPILANQGEAWAAGLAILSRVSGLASQVSLGQVPNPAIDAFDTLDVMPPRERYDIPRVLERHVVDTVTHPLNVETAAQQIDGRSTRTEEIVGGS